MAKLFNVFLFVETLVVCVLGLRMLTTLFQLFLTSSHKSVDVPAFVFVKSIESKAN